MQNKFWLHVTFEFSDNGRDSKNMCVGDDSSYSKKVYDMN